MSMLVCRYWREQRPLFLGLSQSSVRTFFSSKRSTKTGISCCRLSHNGQIYFPRRTGFYRLPTTCVLQMPAILRTETKKNLSTPELEKRNTWNYDISGP